MEKPTLVLGSSGPYVFQLRQLLTWNGFDSDDKALSENSVFDSALLETVKCFQSSHVGPDGHVLDVDGVVGPKTWWALTHSTGGDQVGLGVLSDMPVQEPSNAVAKAALESAWGELRQGVREVPDGSNRGPEVDLYTGLVGKPTYGPGGEPLTGPPWCAYFVSWNFARSPGGSPFHVLGGAQAIVAFCAAHVPGSVSGQSSSLVVKPGDVGVMVSGPVKGHALHVAAVKDGVIWTVEGNSGSAVRTRKRPIASVRWFVNFDRYARERGLS